MRSSTKHIRDCADRNQAEEQGAPIDASRAIQNEGDLDPAMVKRYARLRARNTRPIGGMQSEDEIEAEIEALEGREFQGIANHRVKNLDEQIDATMLAGHDRQTAKDAPLEELEDKDKGDTES